MIKEIQSFPSCVNVRSKRGSVSMQDWRTGPLLSQPPFEEEKTKTRRSVCSVRDGRVVTDSSGTHCHLHLSHLSRTRQEVDYVDLWVRFFLICMCLQFSQFIWDYYLAITSGINTLPSLFAPFLVLDIVMILTE